MRASSLRSFERSNSLGNLTVVLRDLPLLRKAPTVPSNCPAPPFVPFRPLSPPLPAPTAPAVASSNARPSPHRPQSPTARLFRPPPSASRLLRPPPPAPSGAGWLACGAAWRPLRVGAVRPAAVVRGPAPVVCRAFWLAGWLVVPSGALLRPCSRPGPCGAVCSGRCSCGPCSARSGPVRRAAVRLGCPRVLARFGVRAPLSPLI